MSQSIDILPEIFLSSVCTDKLPVLLSSIHQSIRDRPVVDCAIPKHNGGDFPCEYFGECLGVEIRLSSIFFDFSLFKADHYSLGDLSPFYVEQILALVVLDVPLAKEVVFPASFYNERDYFALMLLLGRLYQIDGPFSVGCLIGQCSHVIPVFEYYYSPL